MKYIGPDFCNITTLLTDEELLIQKTANEFVTKEFMPLVNEYYEKGSFPVDLIPKMGELGFFGATLPKKYGGSEISSTAYGLIMQELEKGDSGLRSVCSVQGGLVMYPIFQYGTEEQKDKWLPKLASGKAVGCFGLTESNHGSDPGGMTTKAVKDGDNFKISGEKTFVIDGHTAGLLIVAARTDGSIDDSSGISLFLVDPNSKGIEITKTSMVDSRNAASIQFKDAIVSSSEILGEQNNGAGILEEVLDRAQIAISAEMLGNASQAFDITLEYLKERKQFGAVIGTFQALQHRAAEMYSELELTKSSVIAACNAVDENSNDLKRMASLAKFKAGETNYLVTNEAVQMHGGVGVTDEYDVGLYMKRARVTEQIFGNSEYHLDRYATLSDY